MKCRKYPSNYILIGIKTMKTFIDYLLGGLFMAAMGFGLALIYIYRTGGF
jgi:hypothetical protein